MNRRNFLKNLAKAAGVAACVPLAVEAFRPEKKYFAAVPRKVPIDKFKEWARGEWYPWHEHSEKEVKERFEALGTDPYNGSKKNLYFLYVCNNS